MKVPVFIVRYVFEKWDYPPFMYENYGIYLSKSQAISEDKKLYKKYAKEELLTVVIEQQKEVYSAIDGKKLSPDFEVLFRIDAFDGFIEDAKAKVEPYAKDAADRVRPLVHEGSKKIAKVFTKIADKTQKKND